MHTPKDPVTREAMVALQGYWKFMGPEGPFDVDWSTMEPWERYIENFNGNAVGQKLPIFDVHNKEEAYGWIQDLYIKPAIDENDQPILDEEGIQRMALYAMVEWNSLGQIAIGDKQFLYLSPSFQGVWQNPLTKITYEDVLFEVSLTNDPYQKYLNALKLSGRPGKRMGKDARIDLSLFTRAELIKKSKETKGATMADYEMDPKKKEMLKGAKEAEGKDFENKKVPDEADLSEKKEETKCLSADDHMNNLSESLKGLAETFKGKEGHGDAKKLATMLKKHYEDLKTKHFPDEEEGDKPSEPEEDLCQGKKLSEPQDSPEKTELAATENKRMRTMLSEIRELQTFKRTALVERTHSDLVAKKLIKSGESDYLKGELVKLSEINDSMISLSEGAGQKSFDLMGRVGKIIERCCHPIQLHTEPKGTGAPQPEEPRISLSERKLKMTKEYSEKHKMDFLQASGALAAAGAFDELPE